MGGGPPRRFARQVTGFPPLPGGGPSAAPAPRSPSPLRAELFRPCPAANWSFTLGGGGAGAERGAARAPPRLVPCRMLPAPPAKHPPTLLWTPPHPAAEHPPPPWAWVLPAAAGLVRLGGTAGAPPPPPPPPLLLPAPAPPPPPAAAALLRPGPGWRVPCEPLLPLLAAADQQHAAALLHGQVPAARAGLGRGLGGARGEVSGRRCPEPMAGAGDGACGGLGAGAAPDGSLRVEARALPVGAARLRGPAAVRLRVGEVPAGLESRSGVFTGRRRRAGEGLSSEGRLHQPVNAGFLQKERDQEGRDAPAVLVQSGVTSSVWVFL